MNFHNTTLQFFILCSALLGILLFSAGLGTVSLSWNDLSGAIFSPDSENLASRLVWQVRIPRFFLAMLSGGVLAVCGQAMQLLVRNPLADPYTMGTASGASLGVHLALAGWIPVLGPFWFWVPLWAFAGAFGSSVMVLLLSGKGKHLDQVRFLLTGVAVSMLANALLSLLTYISARQTEIRHMLFWAFGNLDKATWETLLPVSLLVIFPLLWLFSRYQTWPFLLLDEAKAFTLGIRLRRVQMGLLMVVALLTGLVVSLAGPIGFVGMVVPFITRKWMPISKVAFWPLTFLAGAVFLSCCDLLSRILYMPFGLPVGLVSSLVGLPFFLYLLRDSGTRTDF